MVNKHRIQRVSKLTGLSKDVIRVWERRYNIIKPIRGPNRYRIYTDQDIALLQYIRAEMEKGASIGELAALGREELISRIGARPIFAESTEPPSEPLIGELLKALNPLDPASFERRLDRAVAVISFEEALYTILLPLQERVGQLWHDGQAGIEVEHYVTKQVQQKIFSAMNQLRSNEIGPKVVVACGPGEEHEIGAQTVAFLCKVRGCRVHYLGANVPAPSLAGMCRKVRSDLVLLSFTMTLSNSDLADLVHELSETILPICPVWTGGQGAQSMKGDFQQVGFQVLDELAEFERRLTSVVSRFLAQDR